MPTTKLTLRVDHTIKTVPDMATLTLAVETASAKAEEAAAMNAETMRKVLDALKDNGVSDTDLRTASLVLNARNSPRDQPPLRIIGYEATNTLSVTVRNLARLSLLIQQATAAGANNIRGVRFSLLKPEALLDDARSEALKKAMLKADLYANVAGLKVSQIVEIRDDGEVGYGEQTRSLSKSAAPPIEAGEIALSVGLEVIFELEKR